MPGISFAAAEAILIGLAAGLLAGAFGVGGGILSTPLMRMFLGLSPHAAIGTTLAVIVPTAVSGSFNYLKQKQILFPIALSCGIPAIIGTVLGSHATRMVQGQHLMLGLAGLMIVVGLDFISGFGAKLRKQAESIEEVRQLTTKDKIVSILIGLLVGFVSGLLGIGGGFVMIPVFTYFFQMPIKAAFGTSLLVVACISIPGTVVHYLHGQVDLPIALWMLIGSVPGAWLGSHVSLKAKDRMLKMIFGCILIIMAVVFVYRELFVVGGIPEEID